MSLFGERRRRASINGEREIPLDDEEQVSHFIQQFLNGHDPVTRDEILRDRRLNNPENQSATSTFISFFKNFIDVIGLGLFPIVLARVITRLLSAVTFSNDIIQDVFDFYYNISNDGTGGDVRNNLILKFCQIIMYEMGKLEVDQLVKILTVVVYIGYSVLISSYMVFTFAFYSLCLVLTTTRRWSEIDKFLVNVFKSSNGVF